MALALDILALSRAKSAPEAPLADAYLARARDAGRALGFSSFTVNEIDERKPEKLLELASAASLAVALDERGKSMGSEAFAAQLAKWRDEGLSRVVFMIGAADGLPPAAVKLARSKLAFGTQTWPHMLVRVMLAEQLYRAVTIIGGHPYHRA